ncbi:MAG: zinc ribbon domain-containing protein [Myxococcota bacterium]|nr:zinc ribbon domain-containing protein [Myxococcota bacterium]
MEITKEMVERTATALKLEDITKRKVLTTPWQPKLQYAWDDGPAIGRYLAELKNGRIIARTCRKCRRIMIPPRMFCELCWRPSDDWTFVKDTGTVNTFVISHRSLVSRFGGG